MTYERVELWAYSEAETMVYAWRDDSEPIQLFCGPFMAAQNVFDAIPDEAARCKVFNFAPGVVPEWMREGQ